MRPLFFVALNVAGFAPAALIVGNLRSCQTAKWRKDGTSQLSRRRPRGRGRPSSRPSPRPPGPTNRCAWSYLSPPAAARRSSRAAPRPRWPPSLGQNVFVENKPGGSGNIAMQECLNAGDGHTLVLGHIGTLAVNPYIFAKLPYDANRDFEPVSLLAKVPSLYVVHPAVQAKDLKEFVALAKAKPGQLNYGSAGNGSAGHLAMEYLKMATGIFVTHVPYRGTGPQMTDLLAGRLRRPRWARRRPALHQGRQAALHRHRLAQRLPQLPDVPTVAEQGWPGLRDDPVVRPDGAGQPVRGADRQTGGRGRQSRAVAGRRPSASTTRRSWRWATRRRSSRAFITGGAGAMEEGRQSRQHQAGLKAFFLRPGRATISPCSRVTTSRSPPSPPRPGRGAVGIVRVSAPSVAAIVEAVCGRALKPREATYLPFLAADGGTIDQGLAIHFPAPHLLHRRGRVLVADLSSPDRWCRRRPPGTAGKLLREFEHPRPQTASDNSRYRGRRHPYDADRAAARERRRWRRLTD